METTRRDFLKAAAASACTLIGPGRLAGARAPFRLPIGVCTTLEHSALCRTAGAAYIEVGVRRFLVPDKSEEAFAANLEAAEACGLPLDAANGFLPGSLKSVGPEANHEGVLAFAETSFERARRAGIRIIVFGSSGSHRIPEGFKKHDAELQFVALLAKMAPLAEKNGVTVVVEPLNSGEVNFINTLHEGARLVEPVDHRSIRLLADIYHMMRMEEPPGHIRDVGRLLEHVHIAEKGKRTPPGVEGDDFKPYLQALKDAGYGGRVSLECGWKDMAVELPAAVESLGGQMSRVE